MTTGKMFSNVHNPVRRLTLIYTVTGLIAVATFGGFVGFLELKNITEEAVTKTRFGVIILLSELHVAELELAGPAFSQITKKVSDITEGEIVHARINGVDGKPAATYGTERHFTEFSPDQVKAYLNQIEPQNIDVDVTTSGLFVESVHGVSIPGGAGRALLQIIYKFPIRGVLGTILQSIFFVVMIIIIITGATFPIVRALVNDLSQWGQVLQLSHLETLETLGAAIAKRDSDTGSHNYRVAYYAVRLSEATGAHFEQILDLIVGAFLHDVGKIGVRDSILLKPGRLTGEEFEEIKTHVPIGMDIVSRSAWLKEGSDVVGSHHEKWDGTGYPNGLSGDEIPLNARIFAIVDVFDALTSRRPYKEPLPVSDAEEIIIKGRNKHFDGQLVDVFLPLGRSLMAEVSEKDETALKQFVGDYIKRYFIQV